MNSNSVETENLKDTIRRLQRIIELRNEEIKILEEQLEDKMLENQMLRNSNSKSLYDSVCSKLDNVTQKLSSAVKLELVEEFAKSLWFRRRVDFVVCRTRKNLNYVSYIKI